MNVEVNLNMCRSECSRLGSSSKYLQHSVFGFHKQTLRSDYSISFPRAGDGTRASPGIFWSCCSREIPLIVTDIASNCNGFAVRSKSITSTCTSGMSFGSVSTSKVDYALPSPPSDGVSDLTFSPNGTLITAGSWDNGVRNQKLFPEVSCRFCRTALIVSGLSRALVCEQCTVLCLVSGFDIQ